MITQPLLSCPHRWCDSLSAIHRRRRCVWRTICGRAVLEGVEGSFTRGRLEEDSERSALRLLLSYIHLIEDCF
eukprot:scaffold48926_cov32-Tisochrysis_lutea.AAC.2